MPRPPRQNRSPSGLSFAALLELRQGQARLAQASRVRLGDLLGNRKKGDRLSALVAAEKPRDALVDDGFGEQNSQISAVKWGFQPLNHNKQKCFPATTMMPTFGVNTPSLMTHDDPSFFTI